MGIVKFEIGGFPFDLVDGDELSENIVEGNLEVIVPVYGSPYLRYNNPNSSGYTENTISLEGPSNSFAGLAANVFAGVFTVVPVTLDTAFFFNCIVIGVSSQTNITHSEDRIKGQIKVIRI